MTNEEKIRELARKHQGTMTDAQYLQLVYALEEMAQWEEEQYKIAYVVTRSEEHDDYVEKVFFDKEKAEEYCKTFNEDENSYHRDITKIEVSL